MKKLLIVFAVILTGYTSIAQLGGLGKELLKGKSPLDNLLKKTPITTNLEDAKWAVDSLDNFTPREAVRSLITLQRTPNGGFVLQPGYYEMPTQSYCLKAGTHGPGGGDGYLFAPPEGPMDEIVMALVRNSVNKPEIKQQDIQVLLWGIIARSKFEDLDHKIKLVATQMLTPKQLVKLNGGALGLIPESAMQKALSEAPPAVRSALQAEADLRRLLTTPGASFAEMERVAVLSGAVGIGPGSKAVPMGRWSLHPDGYYVRYLPKGYSYTVVQVWVPNGSPAVGKEYDPSTHIAVPGNTSRQRLIQSGRPHQQ